MALLVGSFTIGLILSLLALGILISYRVVAFRDLTVDGSLTLGGAVAATMIAGGFDPLSATAVACLAGALAGAVTATLTTRFQINELLSGILVMTALYSVNLRVMGRSNVPLLGETTFFTWAESSATRLFGEQTLSLAGWQSSVSDTAAMLLMGAAALAVCGLMYLFFRTHLGLAMRAVGDNQEMIRAQGVNVGLMTTLGLALANALHALAGALLAQYQGFADVQMGIGMLVWGLASVIIGESLVGKRPIALLIVGAVMGSILFRLMVAIALRFGLNPNDLKLVTALFVLAALVLPKLPAMIPARWRKRLRPAKS
jgi:putative ABC transport system permease protein